jgi:hypothetical protein
VSAPPVAPLPLRPAAGLDPLALDHLVVAAASLEQGALWCEQTLGVPPGPGGRHALMGTHNRLLRIDGPGFPLAYLEIIAIDPQAPAPGRARWFGLDAPALQARAARQPVLVHLVARCGDLARHSEAWRAAGLEPGEALQAGRDTPQGRLQWHIAVRPDGQPGCGGALPTLIQWQGRHPADAMPPSPVSLRGLVLRGLPGAAQALLRWPSPAVSMPAGAAAAGPALSATLQTPRGPVTLDSL